MNAHAVRFFRNVVVGVFAVGLFAGASSRVRAAEGAPAAPQLPDFTYQGQLQQNGQPASGNFTLTFALFNAASGGSQVGATITEPPCSQNPSSLPALAVATTQMPF